MKFLPYLLRSCLLATFFGIAQGKDEPWPAGDAVPIVVKQVPPDYPKELAKKRIKGEAVVEFVVEKDGTVQTGKIVSQTDELFGRAALACVKKWKFKPGTKAGAPVRVLMQVPIQFGP